MKNRRRLALLAAGASAALLVTPVVRAATPAYSTQLLHFAVHVGPAASPETCDVVGERFTPASASPTSPVPAILTTNGFGGSYTDQIGLAEFGAENGYSVLTYSGLGFGGSGCKITLDDPAWDGEAASQLISYLGGEGGIAFRDAGHTQPAAVVDDVVLDNPGTHDPRVGMIGGSYGGEIQFAAADVDRRLDTIIPFITWNSLNYSLAPNNAGLAPNGPVTSPVPGAAKSTWALGFSALGIADGVQGAQADPSRLVGCPNFATFVCPGLAYSAVFGYPDPATAAGLAHASVASYMPSIRIPTLIIQGENDTLFNLNEAIANYTALRSQRTPVSMIWQSWGHSGGTPAAGELDLDHPDASTQYESARVLSWFDHYLKGLPVDTGPGFAYFQDWVKYSGNASAAYATARSFPSDKVTTRALFLSGGAPGSGGQLVASRAGVVPGMQAFVTPPGGVQSTLDSPDAVGGSLPAPVPDTNLPGTFATWTTAPLGSNVDVVGVPVVHLRLSAPTAALSQNAGPAGDLVLFVKIYDVAPDGTASLIHGLVAPARIADVTKQVVVTLPGIVHRFAVGHSIRLVIAGGDTNYRGGVVGAPVAISAGDGQVLELPVGP